VDEVDVGRPVGRCRDDVQLLAEQLDAFSRWHQRRRATEEVVELRGLNRELRLDLQRRHMVRARQQEALLARAALQLSEGARLLRSRPPRALIAHRQPWLREKVAGELARRGVDVIALLEDGADAVGVAVAEQPDLVVVQDTLPTMSGLEVLAALREFCAHAHLAALVDGDARVPVLLQAGAARAFARRTPPADVARDLVTLVRAS
jgi:CheY-like chemotaxis protein